MCHQPLSFQISFCAIGQVVGKDELACRKFLEIAGQTSVARIASAKDYAGTRIERCDGTELEDIVGHFIDDTFDAAAKGFQVLQVRVAETSDGTLMFRGRPGPIFVGTASELDAETGFAVSPGKHTLVISRPGYRDRRVQLDMTRGKTERLDIRLEH